MPVSRSPGGDAAQWAVEEYKDTSHHKDAIGSRADTHFDSERILIYEEEPLTTYPCRELNAHT